VFSADGTPDVFSAAGDTPDVFSADGTPDVFSAADGRPDVFSAGDGTPDVFSADGTPDVFSADGTPDVFSAADGTPDVFSADGTPDVLSAGDTPDVFSADGTPDVFSAADDTSGVFISTASGCPDPFEFGGNIEFGGDMEFCGNVESSGIIDTADAVVEDGEEPPVDPWAVPMQMTTEPEASAGSWDDHFGAVKEPAQLEPVPAAFPELDCTPRTQQVMEEPDVALVANATQQAGANGKSAPQPEAHVEAQPELFVVNAL